MATSIPDLGTATTVNHPPLKEVMGVRHELGHAWKKSIRNKSPEDVIHESSKRTHHWAETNDAWITKLMASPTLTHLALAGDWHHSPIAATSAFQAAHHAGAQAIVHMGDLGVWPGDRGRDFLGMLELLTLHFDLPLLFVDGNHEDFTQLEAAHRHTSGVAVLRPRVLHLRRGTIWTWAGHRFGALGGATSIDRLERKPGRTWWPQESITDEDVERLLGNANGAGVDVLLTHDTTTDAPLPSKPLALPSQIQLECHINRQHVSRAVAALSPRLLVHGHYHETLEYRTAHTQALSLNKELDEGSLALLTLKAN